MTLRPTFGLLAAALLPLGCTSQPATAGPSSGTGLGGSTGAATTPRATGSAATLGTSGGSGTGRGSTSATHGTGGTSGGSSSSGSSSMSGSTFCELPGSVVYGDGGAFTVPGAADAGQPDFSWLTLPAGFCVHHYAVVPNARQLRFAPGGELFVASPGAATISGGQGGLGAIVVVPDDDHDGFGDSVLTFESGLPFTQGLLFANGSLYYQDHTAIVSEPYASGQRTDDGEHTTAVDITVYQSQDHWPKTLDISDQGQIFVGNGGDEGSACVQPMPFSGGILQIDGSDGGSPVAMGFRNPIHVKCHHDGNNRCFAAELALDGSGPTGGREKLVPINPGDDWGFPCCATTGVPYAGVTVPCPGDAGRQCPPDCSGVAQDTDSFMIGHTPFSFDFVDDQFPPPWNDQVIVGLHGEFGSWEGARLVAIDFDSSTGLLLPGSTVDGGDSGNLRDFATGWDDGTRRHGRPTDVVVAPDGRLFVADDQFGEIFWIAAVGR